MTDIVERLCSADSYGEMVRVMTEAAHEIGLMRAEIEQLQAANERLRAELSGARDLCDTHADIERQLLVEINRLQAEREFIPGTNIPDAGTPSY